MVSPDIYLTNVFIADMDIFSEKVAEQPIQDIVSADESQANKELNQFDVIYGKSLRSPILGYCYKLPSLPTSYVSSIILDTTLLHVRLNDKWQ